MNERVAAAGQREELQPIIDAMLSHVPKGMSASEADCNQAKYMKDRWRLERKWADLAMEGARSAPLLLQGCFGALDIIEKNKLRSHAKSYLIAR